ncbi:MAG: RlmE family RNA methyltransferase [Pseudomonadota bacterium]
MMKSNPWFDYYAKKAKEEGYPARSIYKLAEIQRKYRIIEPGSHVLDLGSCPGGWLLFASREVGKDGLVVGVDINPMDRPLPDNTRFIQGDILTVSEEFLGEFNKEFDCILSDMAPYTSGNKFVDTQRSIALCTAACLLASGHLRPKAPFVCKVFQGAGFEEFIKIARNLFEQVKLLKPQATRKESREIYLIGFNKKRGGTCQVILNGAQ